jgi:cyanophycinase
MQGPVALVGGGEFCPSLLEFDRGLLAATGRRRPRVALLATGLAPEGSDAIARSFELCREHFAGLGAEVEEVPVHDRDAANDVFRAQAVGEADVIYVGGGSVGYLRQTLVGSAVWAAAEEANGRGAILVGSGAGAMVLGERMPDVGLRLGWPFRWPTALAAATGVGVLPDYDARPEPMLALLALSAPSGLALLGIDRDTAVIGWNGSWEVHGIARVTVWRGRHRERHRRGDAFRLEDDARAP